MEYLKSTQERVRVAVRLRNVPTRMYYTEKRPRQLTPIQKREDFDPTSLVAYPIDTDKDGLASVVSIVDPDGRKTTKEFTFDSVFSYSASQEQIYNECVKPIISRCLEGYNGCIFAYGQTGSGKTFTMEGPKNPQDKDRGVILRAAEQIVNYIQERKKAGDIEFTVTGSYLEIYQEHLRDLLNDDYDASDLKIRINPTSISGKELYVDNLTERLLVTIQDYNKLIAAGTSKRTIAETNMNEVSSRSHSVLTLNIKQYKRMGTNTSINPQDGIECGMTCSKIHLIDLAGSERADATGATGTRLKEGSLINLSLSSLGNVINALSTNSQHVPYRDSKLTYLLSDSLGGNCLTLVLACVTPIAAAYEESVSTLRFAERAKKIQNKARVNMDPTALRILALETEVAMLREQLARCTCGSNNRVGKSTQVYSKKWWQYLTCKPNDDETIKLTSQSSSWSFKTHPET